MRDDQLLLALLQRLDERSCLPLAALERAVADTLSLAEAADVHAHLRQCLNCLSVFSRLQSLQETTVGVPTPAPPEEGLQAVSPAIIDLRDQVGRLLQVSTLSNPPSVLIQGESGTGKSVLARLLHDASPRRDRPFVAVHCTAIPEDVLETEMFGFARGAFTGAGSGKPGLLQLAHGGTIFVDEVGRLPAGLQAKLVGALAEGKVRRVGDARPEPLDVWLMAATTEDLPAAVRGRRFREDLYYRLAVVTLPVPPLRERGGDILMLAEHYLRQACASCGAPAKTLADDARVALREYAWPGNVRELAGVMERAVLLSPEPVVTASMLGLPGSEVKPRVLELLALGRSPDSESESDLTADRLTAALRAAGGDLGRAAGLLGITRGSLQSRLRTLGLLPNDE
jgi:DNA-binding NtrC family response regulator